MKKTDTKTASQDAFLTAAQLRARWKQELTPLIHGIIPFPMTVCFVELQAFTEEVLRVADEETLPQFEAELAARPEPGI